MRLNKRLLPLTLCALPFSMLASELSLTIYNEDFALVRERFDLTLESGEQTVDFTGMTRTLEPASVVLRARGQETPFRIIEQSYRADPITEASALAYFEGETIRFELSHHGQGAPQYVDGRIIRAGEGRSEGPVIEVNGELRFGLPGKPLFPSFGDDSILTPTLTWKIHSEVAEALPVELSYLTGELSWKADYNFVSTGDGDAVELIGWVTATNRSGRVYEDAQLKLLAGSVNRVSSREAMAYSSMVMARDSAAPPVSGEAFDAFHLYTIAEPTTLRDQETKQVEFLRASGVQAPRIYRAVSQHHRRANATDGSIGAATQSLPVQTLVTFENSEANQLGTALPAGVARFYREGRDGDLEFVGENRINHTPRDETVTLQLGEAFDLVAERRQTHFRHDSQRNRITETIEITLRNQSDENVTIEVIEHLFRFAGWEIRSSSASFEEVDSRTIRFPTEVASRGEATLSYTVEYNW